MALKFNNFEIYDRDPDYKVRIGVSLDDTRALLWLSEPEAAVHWLSIGHNSRPATYHALQELCGMLQISHSDQIVSFPENEVPELPYDINSADLHIRCGADGFVVNLQAYDLNTREPKMVASWIWFLTPMHSPIWEAALTLNGIMLDERPKWSPPKQYKIHGK